jgi:hypothetical protein
VGVADCVQIAAGFVLLFGWYAPCTPRLSPAARLPNGLAERGESGHFHLPTRPVPLRLGFLVGLRTDAYVPSWFKPGACYRRDEREEDTNGRFLLLVGKLYIEFSRFLDGCFQTIASAFFSQGAF